MFTLLYFVKHAALPPTLILLLLLAGFFLSLGRWRRSGLVSLALGILLYGCLSIGPAASILVRPLESAYPPLGRDRLPPRGTLVVLGGGVSPRADLLTSSRLGRASLTRGLEAVRLYYLMTESEIVVCGGRGNPYSPVAEAPVMRDFLVSVGIPEGKVLVEKESRTTFENVERLLAMPLRRPLVLITSARHMSRAMKVFGSFGQVPVPAPCDFQSLAHPGDPLYYLPSLEALAASTSALYEYLGMVWYRVSGRF